MPGAGQVRARPFSELFNVAASRPAKSPRISWCWYACRREASRSSGRVYPPLYLAPSLAHQAGRA